MESILGQHDSGTRLANHIFRCIMNGDRFIWTGRNGEELRVLESMLALTQPPLTSQFLLFGTNGWMVNSQMELPHLILSSAVKEEQAYSGMAADTFGKSFLWDPFQSGWRNVV